MTQAWRFAKKKRERKQFVVKCGFVQPILLSLYFVEERKNVWIVTLFAQFIHSYMRNVDRCMWYIHKCIALNAAYETFFSCVVLSALLHLPPPLAPPRLSCLSNEIPFYPPFIWTHIVSATKFRSMVCCAVHEHVACENALKNGIHVCSVKFALNSA